MTRGGFDLNPVWESLNGQVQHTQLLSGLFIAFQEHLAKLGLESIPPPHIENMSLPEQTRMVALTFGQDENEALVEKIPTDDFDFNTHEMPTLEPHELIPLVEVEPLAIPAERRHLIIQHITQGLKKTSLAKEIDFSQLAFRLDEYFERFFSHEKNTLDLSPLLKSIQDLPSYSDEEIYVGLVYIQKKLGDLGISSKTPDLGITPDAAERILSTYEPKTTSSKPQKMLAKPNKQKPSVQSTQHKPLKNFYIPGFSPARVTLILTLIGLSIFAWFNRPNRPLDPSQFPLPLNASHLRDGIFVGLLDETHWYALSSQERKQRLERMESTLQARKLSKNAIIVDRQNRIVVRSKNNGKLDPSQFVMNSPNGKNL